MLERAKVEHAHGTVGADRGEDVAGGGGPGDVVDFPVVGDELGDRDGGGDVPDGAGLREAGETERSEGKGRLAVSIEEVTICVGSRVDQEKDVRGAE